MKLVLMVAMAALVSGCTDKDADVRPAEAAGVVDFCKAYESAREAHQFTEKQRLLGEIVADGGQGALPDSAMPGFDFLAGAAANATNSDEFEEAQEYADDENTNHLEAFYDFVEKTCGAPDSD